MKKNNSQNFDIQGRLFAYSKYASYTVILVAVMVLVGWQFNIEVLKRIVPGLVAMNPLTAVCFILSAISVLLLRDYPVTKWKRRLVLVIGCLVAAVAALVLSRYIWSASFWPDRLFFTDKLNVVGQRPNLMAPNTAFNFILIGSALVLIDVRTKTNRRISQYFAVTVAFVALFALIGYAYGSRSLIGVRAFIPIALHTATCFILIATALLSTRPKEGMMFLFTNNQAAGSMTRRLLVAAVLIPSVLGWVRILGQNARLYNTELGVALFVVSNILVFAVIIWVSGGVLYRKEVEVAKAKDEFLDLATHQLQTPLTGVKMSLAILDDGIVGKMTKEQQELISNAIDSNEREIRIVNDLLNVARADSGRMVLDRKPTSLKDMVEDIVKEQMPTIKARHQKVKLDLKPATANIDASRLRMALENLVNNASKYTPDGGDIEISVSHSNGQGIITVSDSGVGIKEQDIAKVFVKFTRLDNPLSKERGGTGLGMYLVKRIVELHSGDIKVDSEIGKGTAFTVALPL